MLFTPSEYVSYEVQGYLFAGFDDLRLYGGLVLGGAISHLITLLIHLTNKPLGVQRTLHFVAHLIESEFVIGVTFLLAALFFEDVGHEASLHILLQPRQVLIVLLLQFSQQLLLPLVLLRE